MATVNTNTLLRLRISRYLHSMYQLRVENMNNTFLAKLSNTTKEILYTEFSNYEWKVLKNVFSKAEAIFPIDKVEPILKEYDESLKKATENHYVDLDAVFIVPSYQNNYRFHRNWLSKMESSEYQYRSWFVNLLCKEIFLDLNNIIRLATGEVENMNRTVLKDSSKHPDKQRSIGWLKAIINGTEIQTGFLEVIGNAIIENYRKNINDLNKVLKAL
ncbi:6671_t:CDS:2 [Dentiscutata heterogama]|uniref:6671_t:CDS:1 n=1 Tax=Dentiscutata heterogama TaxID=1316150 RepID=A0ACA9KTP8_9GLOM|nr:6671_t:CDS:2 [Dentiscutata heterogama]